MDSSFLNSGSDRVTCHVLWVVLLTMVVVVEGLGFLQVGLLQGLQVEGGSRRRRR